MAGTRQSCVFGFSSILKWFGHEWNFRADVTFR
jgi:hypothetical protein